MSRRRTGLLPPAIRIPASSPSRHGSEWPEQGCTFLPATSTVGIIQRAMLRVIFRTRIVVDLTPKGPSREGVSLHGVHARHPARNPGNSAGDRYHRRMKVFKPTPRRMSPPPSIPPGDGPDSARRRLLRWALVLVALLLLAGVWIWSPLHETLSPGELGRWLARFRYEPWAPLAVLAIFTAGGLIMLPVTLMVVLTAIAFGPVLGFVYALLASTASGGVSFLIGRRLGHRHVEQLAGSRIHDLSRRIGRHGFLTIALLRMVPVAHFTVISMAAGTSHIRIASFLAGTVVGMAPGMIVLIAFLDSLAAAAREPDPVRITIALALGLGLVATLLGLRHWLRDREASRSRVGDGD